MSRVFVVVIEIRPPCYYDHFFVVRTTTAHLFSYLKTPLIRPNVLWPEGGRITVYAFQRSLHLRENYMISRQLLKKKKKIVRWLYVSFPALHKNGVLQLKQRDPYMLTNIYIYKGVNY